MVNVVIRVVLSRQYSFSLFLPSICLVFCKGGCQGQGRFYLPPRHTPKQHSSVTVNLGKTT